MKKYILLIAIFMCFQTAFGQINGYKLYAIRTNVNNTKDSFWLKFNTDSLFTTALVYSQRTKYYYDQYYNPTYPNSFERFVECADGIWRNLSAAQVGLHNVDNTSDTNKPVSNATQTALNSKQAILTDGSNIKTINGSSILGSGDLLVTGADATKLAITNNLSDLNNAATARTNLGVSTTANISASTNKNFVTDAQAVVIGNTSGANSGDNAANTTYANDYRAANFVAGTNYLAPNGSAAALTSFPTFNQNTTGTASGLTTGRTIGITGDLTWTSPAFDGTANVTTAGTLASVASAGTTGSSTAIPVITIDIKGRTTGISTAAVIAPAGTLSGNTLASGVTASSLTSFGSSPVLATPNITTGFTIGGVAAVGNTLIGNGTNFITQNTRTNWTTFVVSGSDATTTGQSLVDVTGLNSGTLTNSTLYEVEAWLNVGTTAVTTGTQYGIFGGGTGNAAVVSALMVGTTTTNAATTVTLAASGTAAGTFLTTSGSSGIIHIHGFVTTRSTGTATISIQHLKVTSGTSTVRIGSKFSIRLAN
jgi:hypothetical protein